ncbi:hypothetical protein ACHAWF_013044 [Thalassiosira exigua]
MNRVFAKLSFEGSSGVGGGESGAPPSPASAAAPEQAAAAAEGSSSSPPESRDPTSSQDEADAADAADNGAACAKADGASSAAASDDDDDDAVVDAETPLQIADPVRHPRALKVLFLSSDTGGGHRASATSLAQQFQRLFPGSSYALCDIVQLDGPPPYNMLVKTYKHLSAHPQQWKLVYSVSNTRAYEMLADVHMKGAMERSVRRRIRSYDPDVVVSVHPLMTNVPVLACRNIARETGKHLPIFTVCTDLGSAHSFWFAPGVERLFVASDAIRDIALKRGKVPAEKIAMSGLPIRRDFAVQAEKMGSRHAPEGRAYRKLVREELGLEDDVADRRKTVLVMGGGEGCGRLSNVVDALYLQFVERGIDAVVLAVCGRNDALRESLAKRDWEGMRRNYLVARTSGADFDSCVGLLSDVGCVDAGGMANHLRRIISTPSLGLGGATTAAPFSPAGKGCATSLPGSRSGSPAPLGGKDEDVEVVTKSCAKRNNLYDLSSLLRHADSAEEEGGGGGGGGERGVMDVTSPARAAASAEEGGIQRKGTDNSLVDPQVRVVGLGFVTNMADFMVAADVLVSKAGPGTIAEAASLSLPVLLTSFLPGQEEGNVDYVVEGEFGAFVSDADPQGVSDVVAGWLTDDARLRELSDKARARGAPDAAAEIVEAIGESALRWKRADGPHDEKDGYVDVSS